jgi:hypothetical protein
MERIKSKVVRAKDLVTSTVIRVREGSMRPTDRQCQYILMGVGMLLLIGGLVAASDAQYTQTVKYNDDKIAESVDVVFLFINGTFGALIMVASGVAAILSSAFGQYRAALGLMVVAVGSFILRSLVRTWFNTKSLNNAQDSQSLN